MAPLASARGGGGRGGGGVGVEGRPPRQPDLSAIKAAVAAATAAATAAENKRCAKEIQQLIKAKDVSYMYLYMTM
jgi:hypothetical protein